MSEADRSQSRIKKTKEDPLSKYTFADLAAKVGQPLGTTSWVTVDQKMIDAFADVTNDHQWIHVDVERAGRESPSGKTIAHGYLTLSLLAGLSYELGTLPEGTEVAFNYGLDKVRFLSPVKAGSRIRMHATLMSFDEKSPGQFLMKCSNSVEIEGEEKPAMIAETLALIVAAKGA